jgi:hypothetical protein
MGAADARSPWMADLRLCGSVQRQKKGLQFYHMARWYIDVVHVLYPSLPLFYFLVICFPHSILPCGSLAYRCCVCFVSFLPFLGPLKVGCWIYDTAITFHMIPIQHHALSFFFWLFCFPFPFLFFLYFFLSFSLYFIIFLTLLSFHNYFYFVPRLCKMFHWYRTTRL